MALIDTGAGLVLIDGALPQAAPAILANVRQLGFDPKDIKFILSTEPHLTMPAGLRRWRATPARRWWRARAAPRGCGRGSMLPTIRSWPMAAAGPRVAQMRVMADGEVI